MFAKLFSIHLIISITLLFIITTSESKKISYRLPTNIEPISYTIKLTTYLTDESFTFDGETCIYIDIKNDTKNIILHSNNLRYLDIILMRNDTQQLRPVSYLIDKKNDFLTIEFKDLLNIGTYCLDLKYKCEIEATHTGFLRSLYMDSDYNELWLAFTQLEPTGARKVFPCFDEPAMKAKFTLIINHSNDYKAISNMHEIKSEIDVENPKRRITYFAETPKMSSYIVGIIISNFTYVQSHDGLIRVHARDGVVDNVKHVLDVAQKALAIMKNYTAISYRSLGFRKLDIVVLPNIAADIAGMENWGLITVQEASAVVYEDTQADDKEWNNKVIVHECIHQWFGNLVTIHWWSELWLNEGITTYFHFLISDKIEKTWQIMNRFSVDKSLIYVWKNEAKADALAIKMNIEDPNKMIWNKYYHTYYKSAYLIRLVGQLIGERKFQLVWRKYLKTRSFKTVTSEYIIDEFGKASQINNTIFKEIFNNWLSIPGFPIVNVNRNYATGDLRMEQTRYLTTHNDDSDSYSKTIQTSKYKYWIPINYATENDTNFDDLTITHWMSPDEESIKIKGFAHDQWVIVNKQHYGFYCVNYDETNWDLIIRTLKSKNYTRIHVRNRLQIIFDAFMLVRAKKLSHRVVLSLIWYLHQETDLIPWIPFWSGAEYLRNYIANTEYRERLNNYIAKIMNNIIKRVRFDESTNDDHLIKYYRPQILALACAASSKLCLDAATKKLIDWLDTEEATRLPPALESIILCYGSRNAKYEVWNNLWQRWTNNPNSELLEGLGCTGNASNAVQLLHRVVNLDKAEHTAHLPYAIDAVAKGSNPGVNVALDFLNAQWRPLIEITPPPLLKSLVANVSRCVANDNQFNMLQNFIEQRYAKLVLYGIQPDKILSEGMRTFRRMKNRYPAYEEFFTSEENIL